MELFHLLNRGVDKRAVFLDDADRVRFIHDLFVFNTQERVNPNHRFKITQRRNSRELLVHIHAFCLMDNHYHLLVSEVSEGGISLFMRKLNMGYAKYFNEKYTRTGVLWQGVFKKIMVARDAHFLHIPFYIHLNPLDFKFSEWRLGKVSTVKQALAFLTTYRWSSYLDYIGIKNFPSILYTKSLSGTLGSRARQERAIKEIIGEASFVNKSSALE